jgi:sec-independent protein translocase protein TatB
MLSIPHLIIIFMVALVVFGPNKLPKLTRNLGRLIAEFRRATGDLRSTFDEHMRELEREAQLHERQKQEAERTRQEAERRAGEQSASPQLSPEQSALPGVAAGEPPQAELPLNTPLSADSAPPETVPRERPKSDVFPDGH